MKRNVIIRLCAMALAVLVCLPVISLSAEAAISDLVRKHMEDSGVTSKDSLSEMIEEYKEKQNNTTTKDAASGVISGEWSDETFRRGTTDVGFFEFYDTLQSCTGFTMDYEILEVNKGKMLSGDFKFEVYVRLTDGTWKSVDSFYLDDFETTVDVEFENPLSIDAAAVMCLKQTEFDFVYTFTIRDATCKQSSLPTYGAISGFWWDEQFRRGDYRTYPFEFNDTLTRCKGFTLNYEITEVTKGNLEGNFVYGVYVRNTSGTWKYVDDFKMDGYSTSAEIRFDPMSIDAVAVFCMKNAKLNYSYNFTITDPV